jgi:hypothetical protein
MTGYNRRLTGRERGLRMKKSSAPLYPKYDFDQERASLTNDPANTRARPLDVSR